MCGYQSIFKTIKMARWGRVIAAKSKDLSSSPGTPKKEDAQDARKLSSACPPHPAMHTLKHSMNIFLVPLQRRFQVSYFFLLSPISPLLLNFS